MPFTALKKLSVQTAGSASGTWGAGGVTGSDLNTGVMGPLDTIVAGVSTFSVSSSNVTLSFVAGGGGDVSNCLWQFTGVLTASITVSPAVGDATTYLNGFYLFSNKTTGAFTITLTTANGSLVLPQGRSGILFVSNANSIAPYLVAIAGNTNADPIPVGSTTVWNQAAAPVGWTQVVTLNDYALRLVSGTGAGTGGSTGFNTVFGASVTTQSTTLTQSQVPSLDVKYNNASVAAGNGQIETFVGSISSSGSQGSGNQAAIGGGGGHTHPLSLNILYVNLIQAAKN